MKGTAEINVSVTPMELMKELGNQLGFDYSHYSIENDKVMMEVCRQEIATDIDPEIFKAYMKIYSYLCIEEKGKY